MAKEIQKQLGALPFMHVEGALKFLLITSRTSKNWIIPKGWPKEGMTDSELAALEAYEEAGLGGQVGSEPIGHYDDIREFPNQVGLQHRRIIVFPFLVTHHHLDWPEKGQRKHTWLGTRQAISLVTNPELAAIMAEFDPSETSFS